MPSITNLGRVARLATLPETRRLIFAARRSDALRRVARRVATDRAGMVRDLRDPATARHAIRAVARHPVVSELADAGLMFLPGRYLPIGWAAIWAGKRALRRVAGTRPRGGTAG
jgi:hypothetical protein